MVWNRELLYRHFFNLALEYAIKIFQVNQECLKLNGIRYLPVYVVDDNMSGGSELTLKKLSETFSSG